MDKKLNICVLINDIKVPLWVYKTIENITQSKYTNINLAVSRKPSVRNEHNKYSLGSRCLIALFESIDRLLFRRNHNSHLETDVTSIRGALSIVDLNKSAVPGIGKVEAEVISGLNPDIIILFGRHRFENEILEIPTYGVWTFSSEQNEITGGPAKGFREVIKHQPLTDIKLEVLTPGQLQNEIIYSSREATYHYSVTENRNRVFWRATVVLPRIIEGLSRFGKVYLDLLKERHEVTIPAVSVSEYSGSFLTVFRDLVLHIRYLFNLGTYKILNTDAFNWQLRTKVIRDSDCLELDFSTFKTLPAPRKLFWADPFIIADGGHFNVFVEEFIFKTNKAHLSVLQLDSHGLLVKSEKIIERPYHLSYPYVFKSGGIYFMIPETNQNKTIELYRCTDFPFKWKFEKYIMEHISATDTTLFHYQKKWWLFTTIDQTGGFSSCSVELFLFYSDDPVYGEWISHPLNPVISDESRARCAGKLYLENGKIFRPSQDCSMRYGRGLNINHVTKLNEQEYNEVLVNEIKPDWDPALKGVHTINRDGNMIIIDTYRFHRRLSI